MLSRFIRQNVRFALAACAVLHFCAPAAAQPWPTKPVRIIAAGTAGGTADIVARLLADALAKSGDDIAAGLARYDEEAGEFGRRAVARARYLGAHLEAQHKPRELRTPAELSRDPEKWIRESGARLRDIPELLELVELRRRPPYLSGQSRVES